MRNAQSVAGVIFDPVYRGPAGPNEVAAPYAVEMTRDEFNLAGP